MDTTAQTCGFALGSVAMRYQRGGPGWQWPPSPAHRSAWEIRRRGPDEDWVPVGSGATARSPRVARLEAVLLLADEPLGSRKIAQLANLADGTEARTLVGALNRLYDTEDCAFRIVEVAGGFQLMSRPKFAPWLQRLHSSPVEVRLSAPAIETLAVVAYRQPVLRAEVEAIRGVQCGEILRQLMERDLVRLAGRSDELGRPFLYGTTKRFLQVFGLCHLDELPQMEWTIPANSPTDNPDRIDAESGDDLSNQATTSQMEEEEQDVSISTETTAVLEDLEDRTVGVAIAQQPKISASDDDDEDDWDDDEEDDDDWDDDEEDEEEEEELDDEEEDEWEEVTEDDEEDADEEEEDEEDEEDDWEDDDEDWDEEEDDWDDDDDEEDDWDDDED